MSLGASNNRVSDAALLIAHLLRKSPKRLLRIAKRPRNYTFQSTIISFLTELKPFSCHHLETMPSDLCDNFAIVESYSGSIYVNTIIDGVIETTSVAREGDWLFCGPKSEVYVLQNSKVVQLYNINHSCDVITSKRCIRQAIQLQVGDLRHSSGGQSRRFMASWGTDTVAEVGDYLVFEREICVGNVVAEDVTGNIYRIAAAVFADTYDVIEE